MSQESAPEITRQSHQDCQTGQAAHDHARQESAVPAQGGAPKGLLQQMEELMAALNADLSQLDADLQSSTDRSPADPLLQGGRTPESEHRPSYRPS
ncbi:hypothetical protein [Streptomyces sp. NBC_01264]|uniref:hypothetical protein n=1 Tax=Streptomyces sp. NBC_01264 TaxID=2903804 RepID=UPI0022582CBB|nr:hypothetical protein [Streptomyces sp. NBC_01264]MCX4783404.1 hypothetical protein [Streptomyces sp. NBC_01264]